MNGLGLRRDNRLDYVDKLQGEGAEDQTPIKCELLPTVMTHDYWFPSFVNTGAFQGLLNYLSR